MSNLFDYYLAGYHLFDTCIEQIHTYTTQITYGSYLAYVGYLKNNLRYGIFSPSQSDLSLRAFCDFD